MALPVFDSQRYLDHLRQLTNGAARVQALTDYQSSSYKMNASLKAVSCIDAHAVANTNAAIRAIAPETFVVYRMTSRHEFHVSLIEYLQDQRALYPAFVSATMAKSVLGRFQPNFDPLVLEIEVPPGFPFAPVDAMGYTGEHEILLPCGTAFELLGSLSLGSNGSLDHLALRAVTTNTAVMQALDSEVITLDPL